MAIQNTQPITIPATSEKTFDSLWISDMIISCPSATYATARLTLKPYDPISKEILNSESRSLFVDDIFNKMQTNSKLASAFEALIEAVDDIIQQENQ